MILKPNNAERGLYLCVEREWLTVATLLSGYSAALVVNPKNL